MVSSVTSKRRIHSAAEYGRRNRLRAALQDMAEVLFGGSATTAPGSNGLVIDREGQGKLGGGRKVEGESSSGTENLSRVKLIEVATERLKAQCKEIEEVKQKLVMYQTRYERDHQSAHP